MPKTKLGKWSVWCAGLFFVFLLIGILVVATGQVGGDNIFDNLYISIPMLLAGLAGVLAFGFGLISIIKSKERSPLAILSTVIGFLIIFFIAGELLGPAH